MGRILLIAGSSSRIPSLAASSIQVMRSAAAFAALGHAVTLLVPSGRGELAGLPVPDERAFYGVSNPFTVVRAFAPRSRLGELLFALAARRRAAPGREAPPWISSSRAMPSRPSSARGRGFATSTRRIMCVSRAASITGSCRRSGARPSSAWW